MTPVTSDPVTPMLNGTPRHKRQASLRVTFADEYPEHVNSSVVYYCDITDDVIANDCTVTSDVPIEFVKLTGDSVKRSTSTESHDNPFALDGELQRKADFILQHSTISRRGLTIADPDQIRPVTETAEHVRTITETVDSGRDEPISTSVKRNQSRVNGINHKAISCKELEQEPQEVLYVSAIAQPGDHGSVSFPDELIEAQITVDSRLGEKDENGSAVDMYTCLGKRDEILTTVAYRLVETDEISTTVANRLGERDENGSAVDNRFTVLTEQSHVGKRIDAAAVITEAERARQCCRIQ